MRGTPDIGAVEFDSSASSLCNGDGGDQAGCTDCPCGNNSVPGSIGGCLSSSGTPARLHAAGNPSISLPAMSDTDLRFSLSGAPSAAFCVLTSGGAVAPLNLSSPCFGLNSGVPQLSLDGLRCAVSSFRRHGGRAADANGAVGLNGAPWGGEGNPPAGIAQAFGGFASGETRYFQVIYRDDPSSVCMRGLNSSQAIRVVFTP